MEVGNRVKVTELERSEEGKGSRESGNVEALALDDFKKIIGLLEKARESSLKRLDKTLSLIEENFEGIGKILGKGDLSCLHYRMCDVDLPEMEVDPTEEEINDVVNGFLSKVVETGRIQLRQLKRELSEVKEVAENILVFEASEDRQTFESPKPKKVKDESGFVASMKRLWENKTPKLSSIWRRNEESKNLAVTRLGVSRLDKLDILDGFLSKEDDVEKNGAGLEVEMENNVEADTEIEAGTEAMIQAETEVEVATGTEVDMEPTIETETEVMTSTRKEPSFKSVSNEDMVSPEPPNAIISMGSSPLQSPPLLALTPSTPIPIVPAAVSHQAHGGAAKNSTTKVQEGEVSAGVGILRTSVVIGSREIESHTVGGKERTSKSTVNVNEDSPLPPRPIRRQTAEKIQEKIEEKGGENRVDEITDEGEQTPILKGGLERTPVDKNRVEGMGENDFVRPEKISHVKKSGLRSILHHSANRIPPDQAMAPGLGTGAGVGDVAGAGENNNTANRGSSNTIRHSRGSTATSHLVKTPINKGFCKMETEGKDKLRIGESPCRRYHKRLKLLPPVNPEECYLLTDSEDEQQGCGVGGAGGGELKITKAQKKIPLWARSMNWIPKMKEQRNVDPFSIFGDSCMFMDLEDVFQRPWYISTIARDNRIKSWQNDRLTSLNWSEDSLTSDELRQYKMRMNLYIDKSNEVYVTEPCFTPSPNPLVNGAWNHINKQRINSGGTTVIRKALNLSIHRFNGSISNKPNSSIPPAPLAPSSSASSSKPSETTLNHHLQVEENSSVSNIENNNITNFLSKPVNSSKDCPNAAHYHNHHPIIGNSSFLQ
ncbi:large low complexity [Cryptosporidium sp. chipmunk genotype I]|uniref:large low complexity n=1 Tax=Cryptosporidium sp. chipmunk genotype I TaxID=1280935 RepID=UPI00351A3518|nr:large low complexity [Cryptosporidium sp. chipmunk genotype I]